MNKPLRFGIVAGEQSGDNLGAGLMQAILRIYPDCQFEGVGGPAMIKLGFKSFFAMERLSVMGFIEPLGRLPELLRMGKQLKLHFMNNPPDAFIGIDSPGFNMRLEKSLRDHGIKTVHYVSPSVWAYAEKRIRKIKQAVDLMLVLFPFETAIYHTHNIAVEFVGHPLADSIGFADERASARSRLGLLETDTVIALMPGSRGNEIKHLAPVFLRTAIHCQRSHPQLKFILPCANVERMLQVRQLMKVEDCEAVVKLLDGEAQTAIAAADLVLLASGTATLETLLLKRPMVICYKLASLTYGLISRMLKVPYVGLPNLLAGKMLVPEYLQNEVTVANLSFEVERFLNNQSQRQELLSQFEDIHHQLAVNANKCAADAVLRLCQKPLENRV